MDVAARRREFPALDQRVHGRRLAYLDSAATSLRPRAVIEAVLQAMTVGSPYRGVHALAEAATALCEGARADLARFLGGAAEEIVFTSGTTAAINLVAQAWGRANLRAGDAIVVGEVEHHSNLVPWQMLAAATGAVVRIAPVDERGAIDLARVPLAGAKLVAATHVSNVTGAATPIAPLAAAAHAAGALLLVDGAQAIAHVPVDVRALGCDFYAFSAHKLYGPTGTGVLWGRAELLAAMPPWLGGGGMVTRVDAERASYREPPARFEAGTHDVMGIAGFGAAVRWLASLDRDAIAADEARAHAGLVAAVREAGGRILGAPETSVVSFELPGVHPHDVATILDGEGVAVRSGHHCAQPTHARYGAVASTRASVGCYTDADDVAQFAAALAAVRRTFP